jgi:hypothetical protein
VDEQTITHTARKFASRVETGANSTHSTITNQIGPHHAETLPARNPPSSSGDISFGGPALELLMPRRRNDERTIPE